MGNFLPIIRGNMTEEELKEELEKTLRILEKVTNAFRDAITYCNDGWAKSSDYWICEEARDFIRETRETI